MKLNIQDFSRVQKSQFRRLGLLYILALCSIAAVIVIGQVMIQNHLRSQLSDSKTINIAGRQRMLSQKIAKLSLNIANSESLDFRNRTIKDLNLTLEQWQAAHSTLQQGENTQEIKELYHNIQPHYDSIYASAKAMMKPGLSHGFLVLCADQIGRHEGVFLQGMEEIVKSYEQIARHKVDDLRKKEYTVLAMNMLLILMEILFIFRPSAKKINKTFKKLFDSEKQANKMAKEISVIYSSLEKSYEQLAKVNEPDDSPKVLAKADRGGNVTMISELYQKFSGVSFHRSMRICDLFPGSSLSDDFMDDLVDMISNLENWSSQIKIKNAEEEAWLDVYICPVLKDENEIREVLIVGTDITKRKRAEEGMYRKNRSEVEKRINQQKYRSVLILEGQEEERKRLAMDIHDGIGQLLTSLKFQMEGINPNDGEANVQKLSEIKTQLNDTIKEVRRVTFNLKPTVLGDFGLAAGLKLFVYEISKYSEVPIVFCNPQQVSDRFSERIENNVFRIVQEAINNAIKYAGASSIEVAISMSGEFLIVTIKDDGKGFDPSFMDSIGIESGSGIFNMHERTEYINGTLEINSVLNKGTFIELHVPAKQLKTMEI